MIASTEVVEQFKLRFDLPEAVQHCLTNAMTAAYLVAFSDPELFQKMEFWQVTDSNNIGPHIYIALPLKGQMQVLNRKITWPDEKYPDHDYNYLRQRGVPADRTKIDRFVTFALEGGPGMKRVIDLITKPGELLGDENSW